MCMKQARRGGGGGRKITILQRNAMQSMQAHVRNRLQSSTHLPLLTPQSLLPSKKACAAPQAQDTKEPFWVDNSHPSSRHHYSSRNLPPSLYAAKPRPVSNSLAHLANLP